jgi:hypothetical protein
VRHVSNTKRLSLLEKNENVQRRTAISLSLDWFHIRQGIADFRAMIKWLVEIYGMES